jgi:hypothetical protein
MHQRTITSILDYLVNLLNCSTKVVHSPGMRQGTCTERRAYRDDCWPTAGGGNGGSGLDWLGRPPRPRGLADAWQEEGPDGHLRHEVRSLAQVDGSVGTLLRKRKPCETPATTAQDLSGQDPICLRLWRSESDLRHRSVVSGCGTGGDPTARHLFIFLNACGRCRPRSNLKILGHSGLGSQGTKDEPCPLDAARKPPYVSGETVPVPRTESYP